MTERQKQPWPAGRAVLSAVVASVGLQLTKGWLAATFPSDVAQIVAYAVVWIVIYVASWYALRSIAAVLRRPT